MPNIHCIEVASSLKQDGYSRFAVISRGKLPLGCLRNYFRQHKKPSSVLVRKDQHKFPLTECQAGSLPMAFETLYTRTEP